MKLRPWISALLLTIACSSREDITTSEENRIFEFVLRDLQRGDGYAVVLQRTELFHDHVWDDEIKKINWLKENEIPPDLLHQLIMNNKKKVSIGLSSDQNHGYLVDSDGSFRKYWGGDGHCDWERIHRDRPKATSFTFLSRPAFDKNKGIVIIYFGQLRGDYDGEGAILVCEYNNGRLKKLKRAGLWISS